MTPRRAASPAPAAATTPRYLCAADAASYLGLTRKALYRRVDRRLVPFIKTGRTLKFDRQRLDVWMRRHAIEPMEMSR